MGSECCHHRKEDQDIVTGNIKKLYTGDFEIVEVKASKQISNSSVLVTREELPTVEAKASNLNEIDETTRSTIQDLYLLSLEIFQKINEIRVNPSILENKIDNFVAKRQENGLCLVIDDKNNPFYMPQDQLTQIKEELSLQKPCDCIMSEEPLYQAAIRYSDGILKNDLGSARQAIIDKISRDYSEEGIELYYIALFEYTVSDPTAIILLCLQNKENRRIFFRSNYQFGTVICGINVEGLPYTLILFVKEQKSLKLVL